MPPRRQYKESKIRAYVQELEADAMKDAAFKSADRMEVVRKAATGSVKFQIVRKLRKLLGEQNN
jgi:hypothetical protein